MKALLLLAVFFGLLTQTTFGQGNFVNFEGKQTSPVRLSADGRRLYAVNTPDGRLSVFDVSDSLNPILMAEIPVGLEPVSVQPRSSDEVWVVNEVSDSISIVSVSRHVVIDTLYVPDEPADVVFANGRAFVTSARKNQIRVFDAVTRAPVTNIAVFGEHPRAIVASADGTRVYAAFALSGNRTTLVPPNQAPPQPPPTNPNLPAPPQVGLIVDATDTNWTNVIRFRMPDNDVVEIDSSSLAITRYFSGVGTVNLGLAVHPASGDLFVANTDARNLTRFEPTVRGNFASNRVSRLNVTSGAITHLDLNPGFSYTNFPRLPELSNALAQPTAIAFGSSGNNFYVAAFGTDRIGLLEANGTIRARIDLNSDASGSDASPRTKRGPRGLALKPGQALYVLNRIANTVSIIHPQSNIVVREIPVGSFDPTPPVIRSGRGFLYDAKLSGNGTVSCATCHVDADMDMIAWDLGDPGGQLSTNNSVLFPGGPPQQSIFHPMKGPMTTQTLRGLLGMEPLHWRGDRTNFNHFNGAFRSLLGGSLLSAADMQAYRDFIETVVFQSNPNQNLDRTLPTTFPNGGNPRVGFTNYTVNTYQPGLSCNICHTLPTGTARVIIPAAALQESQDFKVPHLRNIYQKLNITHTPGAQSISGFGIVHDGMDPNLFVFLSRPVFGTFANNTGIKRNIEAFVQCFDTGTAPAVGYSRTLVAANLADAVVVADWNLLEGQANVRTNIDLIAKGTVDGRWAGLLFDPVAAVYRPDSTNFPVLTRAALRTKISNGDTLTLMGVPPGTGRRIGIDRDGDGILDRDEPRPILRIAHAPPNALLQWHTNFNGYVLEQSSPVPGDWTPALRPRTVSGEQFTVTNSITSSNAFFRLREL